MDQTRLLLLRHAETSDPNRFHGAESDIGLGDRGFQQAVAVARYLATEKPDSLYSSAMTRAVQTAERIADACGLAHGIIPELHERKIGPMSGVSRVEGLDSYSEAKRRWISGDVHYTHEGGESFDEIRRRVVPIIERLARESPGKTLVVVAHGVVIRVILATLLEGHGPSGFDKFAIDNVAINDLLWDGRSWSAASLNRRIGSEQDGFAW